MEKPFSGFNLAPKDDNKPATKPTKLTATFLGPSPCHTQAREKIETGLQRLFGNDYTEQAGKLSITCEDASHDKRLYLIIVALVDAGEAGVYRLGHDWLYDRKITKLERSVDDMVKRVTAGVHADWQRGAWVDEHMRDQLVIFQALSEGGSQVWAGELEPSLHTQTAEWVVACMLQPDSIGESLGALSLTDKV